MRLVILLSLLAATGGCAVQPEVMLTLGARQVSTHEDERGLAASLIVVQRFGERGVCLYSHFSDPSRGRPVNDEYDVSEDFAGCGVAWGGKRR